MLKICKLSNMVQYILLLVVEDHLAAEDRQLLLAVEDHLAAEDCQLLLAAEDQPLPAKAVGHQEQDSLEDVAAGAGEAVQLQVRP